ncbi:MAG: glycerol-3-phosphate dehydrogenase [Bacteroidetes bacterium CG2_30_33_31]|nr:MAG: glycerol-3-phosphate dehydrogenase [Bacteroidetes bacterium CG2_30_33_31]
MIKKDRIAVIGGGSWGTALVKLLQNNVENIGWWIRSQETINYIKEKKRNPQYLSYVEHATEKIDFSNDLKYIVKNYDILVFAIPSAFLDISIEQSGVKDFSDKMIVSAIKGIVPEYNQIVARYFKEKFAVPYENIGIIAGPCHAEEVAMQKLSYLTISFLEKNKAVFFSKKLETWYLKVKTSKDIAGTEYAAMLKNIYALANGICIGLGYGDNFQAVLIVNSMKEIRKFLKQVFPLSRKIVASEYFGDLLVTAYSQFSRNRLFGTYIGKGYSVKATMAEMKMVAEGYYATKCLLEINKEFQVKLPIAEAVYNILYENVSPVIEMKILTEKLS